MLFDFDHTLTDFGHHVRWADARTAVRAVYEAAGVSAAFLDAHPGSLSLYISVAEHQPIADHVLLEAQRRAGAILDEFERDAVTTTQALAGAHEVAEVASRLGLRAGIVTSNAAPVARAILERLGLGAPFEVVLGRSEVRLLKPAPEGILAACLALDVEPAEAVYVGDSESDMRAARAARVMAWGVATGLGEPDALRNAGAEAVFATLTDVLSGLSDLHALTARDS